jgi:rubrerythrin
MQGVVTRVQVLTHPLVIVEGFGFKVLWRALLARPGETFLEVVRRCAEEEQFAARGLRELDLLRTVDRFIGFECRARDLYRMLGQQHRGEFARAARFFATLARQEEGHAVVLSHVRREVQRGRLWKESKELHAAACDRLDALFSRLEAEARAGVPLVRALDMVEQVEGSELDLIFEDLRSSVDARSRARFERFFVLGSAHQEYCRSELAALRGC